jgi:hypothetical protein
MTIVSAKIFSDQLQTFKDMFTNLMSQMESVNVNHKLYPDDQTYSNDYSNWSGNMYTLKQNMLKLSSDVSDSIDKTNKIVNKVLSDIDSSNKFSQMIPILFEKKNTSNDMKIDNINLYKYQILLNWEMFIGMCFLFFCIIFYYRKYYNTKEVIEYTKQTISDAKENISNNIQTAKEEITKMAETPPNTENKE